MRLQNKTIISEEGYNFLNDPVMYNALKEITTSVGSTPEEYLARFETLLSTSPEIFFALFEK